LGVLDVVEHCGHLSSCERVKPSLIE
jgi:hypothetical protein